MIITGRAIKALLTLCTLNEQNRYQKIRTLIYNGNISSGGYNDIA